MNIYAHQRVIVKGERCFYLYGEGKCQSKSYLAKKDEGNNCLVDGSPELIRQCDESRMVQVAAFGNRIVQGATK